MMRGFTLTEAAIVLGIVGLILGAIWVAAASVYSNMRVNTANKQLMTIVQNVRSLYASSATMDAAATMAQLISAGVFPGDTNPGSPAGHATNGWGGDIVVAPQTLTVAGDSFSVSFASVPQQACTQLAIANSGQGRDAGLIGVDKIAKTDNSGVPGTLTNALAGACSVAGANVIVYTFKLKG